MKVNDPAIAYLLKSHDPSIRYYTLTELLEKSPKSTVVKKTKAAIPHGPRAKVLLTGYKSGFKVHPYQKWTGAHWRLVSLMELGLPSNDPTVRIACEKVLNWLTGDAHRKTIPTINGLTRRCGSQEGNALATCTYFGMAADHRVKYLADSLIEWQWPDGGWNCDRDPETRHSSFYETITPLRGLFHYYQATGDKTYLDAAEKAGELFLRHKLFRSERSGKVINQEWLKLHYPLYWHYDILHGLSVLMLVDMLGDKRCQEALDIVEAKRRKDGTWHAGGYYWSPARSKGAHYDVADWGRGGPNEWITLNALRVLKAAGRW
jgi:hypothetical protein